MSFVDFSAVKERVSFSDAIELLGLKLKQSGNQWRGPCPSCQSGGDRALVVTEGRGFYCWGQKKGGDQIALAAHVLELSAKDAAAELADRAGMDTGREAAPTVPRNSPRERKGEETEKLQPLSYLEHEHEAVDAVGFCPEVAQKLGIGYAPRGIMRGTVAVPIRDEQGRLIAYIGITEARLPSDLQPKVIHLKKRA